MSDTVQRKKQIIIRELVIGKKCDVCGREIPPTSRTFPRKEIPFFDVTTYHNDWGNDSVDSYEYFHACSPDCVMKMADGFLRDDFDGINTKTIKIAHRSGWYLPEEVDGGE